jgi:hypothetical protein
LTRAFQRCVFHGWTLSNAREGSRRVRPHVKKCGFWLSHPACLMADPPWNFVGWMLGRCCMDRAPNCTSANFFYRVLHGFAGCRGGCVGRRTPVRRTPCRPSHPRPLRPPHAHRSLMAQTFDDSAHKHTVGKRLKRAFQRCAWRAWTPSNARDMEGRWSIKILSELTRAVKPSPIGTQKRPPRCGTRRPGNTDGHTWFSMKSHRQVAHKQGK